MLTSLRSSLFRHSAVTRVAVRLNSTATPATPVDADLKNPLPDAELEGIVNVVDDMGPAFEEPSRKWKIFQSGNLVKPSDLTPAKCSNERKFKFRSPVGPSAPVARYNDVFQQLKLDPVDFSLNPHVLHAYVSEMGKIYGRNITGLTQRSQRRLGKAIRRARMIGILPQLSRPSKSWVAAPYRRPK